MKSTKYMEDKPIREANKIINQYNETNKRNILIIGVGFKNGDKSVYKSPSIIFANHLKNNKFSIKLYDLNVDNDYLKSIGYNTITERHMTVNYIETNFHIVVVCHCTNVNDIIKQLEERHNVDIRKYCNV